MHRQRDRREEDRDDRRRDQRGDEHRAPPTGEAAAPEEEGDEPADRRREQDGVPAGCGGEAASEPLEVEHAGSVGRVEPVGGHPGEQQRRGGGSRQQGGAGAPQVGALAECDQRRTMSGEHGCGQRVRQRQSGRGDPVRDPAPAAAPLERVGEQQGRGDDPEQPERVGPRLPRGLDDTGVHGERDAGYEPADAAEEHRAEHDEQPGSERDGDRRRRPERELVGPEHRCQLEQQEPAGLARVVAHDGREHGPERLAGPCDRDGLVRRERAMPESGRAEGERAQADGDGRQAPGECD